MDLKKGEKIKSIKLKYLEDQIKSYAFGIPFERTHVFENGLEIDDLIIDQKEISQLFTPMEETHERIPYEKREEYENPTSLKDIYELICSGFRYIELDSDIILSTKDEKQFIDGIDIESSVIIDGCGHTISGRRNFRIFTPYHSAIIKNITFKNCGMHQRHGGAILNHGVTEIENCKFLKGYARFGGAISNFNILIVKDSTFNNNIAGSGGGAIHNEGLLKILSSDFENNACERYGGAVNSERELLINDCTFKNNETGIIGGAINNLGNMKYENCNFENNIGGYRENHINSR